MTILRLDNATLHKGGATLLKDASLSLSRGECVALLGPNGAGKSSLMKCTLGALALSEGRATIDGEDAAVMNPVRRARRVSYLPQMRETAWPIMVRDIVALGRYAYGAGPARLSADDASAVDEAINACGLADLADRRADTLSGGELARAHCARAFATKAPLLLADEPVNSLDPAGQLDIMKLIRAHVEAGVGALVILHDVNLAAAFADRLVWMKEGRIVADGAPAETLTEKRMKDVFDVEVAFAALNGRAQVSFAHPER